MSKIKAHLDNIALSHSVFALPFAYMGAILAAQGIPMLADIFWITIAMVGARSAALALNNFIDLKYDKIHPRFKNRPMVTGKVTPKEAILLIIISFAVFIVAASQLNPICLKLAPLAVLPFVLYPYMKRFSWACHLVLGLALAVAPVGGWIAITGYLNIGIVLLGLAVGIWIAAFDVIYACQDIKFDKEQGLNSMPVRFGVNGAMILSKIMHIVSISSFIAVGYFLNLSFIYYFGVVIAAIVLYYQHSIIKPNDLSKVTQAYFMRNGLVGISIFLFTFIDLLVKS